jgi:hypothetical protein
MGSFHHARVARCSSCGIRRDGPNSTSTVGALFAETLAFAKAALKRDRKLFECYRKYTEFNPVQIHTGIKSKAQRDEIRRKLLSGQSRIVVCVRHAGGRSRASQFAKVAETSG